MIIRLLIYALLFYLGFRLIRILTASVKPGNKTTGQIDDVMIKDPVCNVYFPKKEGVHVKIKGKDLYFCSSKCRENYFQHQTKEEDGNQEAFK